MYAGSIRDNIQPTKKCDYRTEQLSAKKRSTVEGHKRALRIVRNLDARGGGWGFGGLW